MKTLGHDNDSATTQVWMPLEILRESHLDICEGSANWGTCVYIEQ